jgi:cytochrome c
MMAMTISLSPPRSIVWICHGKSSTSAPLWVGTPKAGWRSLQTVSSLWGKPAMLKPVKVSWLVQSKQAVPQATAPLLGRDEEHPMKKLTLNALIVVTSMAAASGALAQDAAAGKTSFNKCLVCHAIGEGAKNKVGPELNGIDGRKSGTAPDYSYSDANKNSGITWNEAQFKEYIKDPKAKIPGTKMAFAGIKNEKEINDLWAFISQYDKDGKTK